jgi:hypothetical protein
MENEYYEVNWLTDIATLKLPSAASSGITSPEGVAGFNWGRNLIGVPDAERQLGLYARRYVDVYAMLMPYRVSIVDKATVPPQTALPISRSKRSDMDLLGFYGGMTFADAGVKASKTGFQSKGCKHPSEVFPNSPVGNNDEDFRYCYFFRGSDEALTINFWRDELEVADYRFGIRRYEDLLKELSTKYGNPRSSSEDPNWKGWGSIVSTELDIDKTADQTEGFASLTFNGGQFGDQMKAISSQTSPSQKWPDIRPEMLPEIKKAEQRLFGNKAAEVDTYTVGGGGALQGTLAVMGGCKPHFCPDHNAMWIVDFSTGHAGYAAGEITNESEVVVCLGDYGSPDELPPVLQAEIKEQSTGEWPSPRPIRYVVGVGK